MSRSFEQDPGEDVIENHDQHDGINDRFGDGTADAARTADGDQSLVAGDNADNHGEAKTFEDAVRDVLGHDDTAQIMKERLERNIDVAVGGRHRGAAEPADEDREDDEHG